MRINVNTKPQRVCALLVSPLATSPPALPGATPGRAFTMQGGMMNEHQKDLHASYNAGVAEHSSYCDGSCQCYADGVVEGKKLAVKMIAQLLEGNDDA